MEELQFGDTATFKNKFLFIAHYRELASKQHPKNPSMREMAAFANTTFATIRYYAELHKLEYMFKKNGSINQIEKALKEEKLPKPLPPKRGRPAKVKDEPEPGEATPEGWFAQAKEAAVLVKREINTKHSEDQIFLFFEAILLGMSRMGAASYAGITDSAVRNWVNRNPIFKKYEDQFLRAFQISKLKMIHKAANKDWKAASYLLETHTLLRDEYKPPKVETDNTIKIMVSIDRGQLPVGPNLEIIDATTVELIASGAEPNGPG